MGKYEVPNRTHFCKIHGYKTIKLLVILIFLPQEAVSMIKPIGDAEEAAKRLMNEAYQRGSSDNITCVVVRFLTNQGSASSRSSSRPSVEG